MSSGSDLVDHVVDLLRGWAPVGARRMFGGHGLYRGGVMFALVAGETLYFKTDEANRPDFEAAGMAPFQYARGPDGKRAVIMSYHEVPTDLLDEGDRLRLWAEGAFGAALRAASRTRRRRPATR